MRRRFAFSTLLPTALVLFGSANLAKAADDYEIHLNRPAKVGDVRKVNESGSDRTSMVMMVNGQKAQDQNQDAAVTLVGEEKVLEVSDKGAVTKYACTVTKCEITQEGKTVELVPAGKIIEVTHAAGKNTPSFKIDGQEVDAPMAQHLNIVLSVSDPAKPNDDATFGTKERKKVGDTWEANKDMIITTLKDMKIPVTKEGMTTQVKLKDVKNVGGIPCMTIEMNFMIPLEAGGRIGEMPQWLSIQSGKFDVSLSGVVPIDPAGQPLSSTKQMSMKATFAGNAPDGSPVSMTITKAMQNQETRENGK
jgi:hypothetical protein